MSPRRRAPTGRAKRPTPSGGGTAPRIGVLCSGRGSNLQAIIDAAKRGALTARVAVVISDKPDAPALDRAAKSGIPSHCIDPKAYPDRAAHEQAMIRMLEAHGVELVCLAGFMRILSPAFVRRFAGRLLNIHPALLPSFPGGHAVRDALAWGVKVTGVTVHLVDEEVDHGPIVLQEAVAIKPGDTEATLLTRLHAVEHRLYVEAIRLVLAGKLTVQGRQVAAR